MKLDEATHYQLLKILTEHPEYTQRQIAAAMGLSLGKTNFCLNALIGKGLVKVGNFRRNQDKRVYAYLLPPPGYRGQGAHHYPFPAAQDGRV